MAQVDLFCRDCEQRFAVVTREGVAIRERQKRCPQCGSQNVRQSFGSYLRNGPLSSPDCGSGRTSYG